MPNCYDFNDLSLLETYRRNGTISIEIAPEGGTVCLDALVSQAPVKSCWQKGKGSQRVVVASTFARQANLPKKPQIPLPNPSEFGSLVLRVEPTYNQVGGYNELIISPEIDLKAGIPIE